MFKECFAVIAQQQTRTPQRAELKKIRGGGLRVLFRREKTHRGGFRRPGKSQSSGRLTHLTHKSMLRSESEGFANQIATESSNGAQPKTICCSKHLPKNYGPTVCSAIGIFTALPKPENFATFLKHENFPQNYLHPKSSPPQLRPFIITVYKSRPPDT